LICKDTSKLISICSGVEQELGRSLHGLSVFERKRRLLAHFEKLGSPLARLDERVGFVGREGGIRQLEAALFLQRRHLVISGPLGNGKSALLRHFGRGNPVLICQEISSINPTCEELTRLLGLTVSSSDIRRLKSTVIAEVKRRDGSVAFDNFDDSSPQVIAGSSD
jgi:hypothetical protein